MNHIIQSDGKSDVPWPTSDHRGRAADSSTLTKTIDRLADSAGPAVRQLGDSVVAAEEALHAKTAQLRATRDEWAEGMRATVRGKPLLAVAGALALGAIIARIIR